MKNKNYIARILEAVVYPSLILAITLSLLFKIISPLFWKISQFLLFMYISPNKAV